MDSELNNNDNLFVIRIRNDSKDAITLLYYRYKKKLYYFSLRYLGNTEEAEELVKAVFIKIWELRKSLNVDMSVINHILPICRKLYL